MASAVLLSVLALAWLTIAMRSQEQSKLLRAAALALHVVYDIMFVMCYASFFDYFTFLADCECMKMPHLLHMSVALTTGLVFMCVTALMVVASSDLDPVSKGFLASPAVYARLKILAAKAAYIILANCLDNSHKVQSIGMLTCVSLIVYWNLRSMPFYRKAINVVWTGLWCGILYSSVLLFIMIFGKNHTPEFYKKMTMNVLYGMFPVVLGCMGLTWLYNSWAMLPARKFKDLPPGTKMSRVHKFESVHEVERLARVMRVFDADGMVDHEAAALGEVIIKAGMQTFPNSAHLLILYANFVLEARRDGPAARTQLQLAGKASPNLVERYQIFCTNEASKRLKDSAEGGMDLQAYIEFKRNYRAVLRVHKEAMLLQAEMWQLCMRTSVRVAQIDNAMEALEAATGRAHQVYRRVLERYPTNGRLLRCYGKFLEDCRHDQTAAARAYGEANRNGGASGMLALDLSGAGANGAGGKPDFLTSMSLEDDAVVVATAEGKILMISQAVQEMFGYAKSELEGANLSLLMPQPFSQRHPGYMARYVGSGEPHILDTVRQVVALHKERYVFPVALCVTKISGTGVDSVFLGLFRSLPPNLTSQRAWVSPNGVFLCADQYFASSVGIMEEELIGHTLSSLVADPEHAERLLLQCREASAEILQSGSIRAQLLLMHRYLDPVPVDVTVRMAGSDTQRILVLHCVRTDGQDGSMLAVDSHMRIRFASCEVAQLIGYPLRSLAGMKLSQLLPQPYSTLHAKWLKDPPHAVPPGSCRSGATVHLLSETGVQVPVQIKVKTVYSDAVAAAAAGAAGTLHIVQVTKLTPDQALNDKRLVLTTDFNGRVLEVSPPNSTLFDFPAASLLGACLSDCVDLFDEWRQRSGDDEVQMLLLALLDKEAEMPGTSWRVKVHAVSARGDELSPLQVQAKMSRKGAVARSACLQIDLLEGTEGNGAEGRSEGDDGSASRILITLWRRDLLAGVVELDEELTIRKANPLTALITGLPVSAMLRKPLGRFLDLPPNASTWEQLVAASSAPTKKKSALKASSDRGAVSPLMAFVGPHPDTGTMRLLVQGVQTLGPSGRPKVTLTVHPDATFVGAHADLMRVLKLDGAGRGSHVGDGSAMQLEDALEYGGDAVRAPSQGRDGKSLDGTAPEAVLAGAEADVSGSPPPPPPPTAHGGMNKGSLHRQSSSKSQFVEQWVKALTKQLDTSGRRMAPMLEAGPNEEAGPEAAAADSDPTDGADAADRCDSKDGLAIVAAHETAQQPPTAQAVPTVGQPVTTNRHAASDVKAWSSRQPSRDLPPSPPRAAVRAKPAGGKAGKGGASDEDDDRSDKNSENDTSSMGEGSQAASAISGTSDATSVTDVVVDARRGRLLKALNRLMLGPSLMGHVKRLHLHSYGLIAVMFLAHLISYIIIIKLIDEQHSNVYEVTNQAMAVDRTQLVIVRTMTGAFCSRPDIAPVSACSKPLGTVMTRLTNAINELEALHQSVYLGLTSKVTRPEPAVYDVWTKPTTAYNVYMDTTPPETEVHYAGAWVLGNRFIAAAREALYWLPQKLNGYMGTRTYQFILLNGLQSVFTVYATSLDLLVNAAWNSVLKLRTQLLILLVVEGLVVQLCATLYEFLLVRRLEQARLAGMMAMLALPGPILRQLVANEAKKSLGDRTYKTFQSKKESNLPADGGQVTLGSQRFRINGKSLIPTHYNVGKFMAPFFLWNLAVVIVYGVSLAQLSGMQEPLASLNMAAHVTYRYTRVRALSLAFVVEPLALRAMLRGVLTNELNLLESEYNALMYGGMPTSLINTTFQHPSPAGTFGSAAFARTFFTTKRCFRYDQSECFLPDSPYYEVTHNGLDVLVRRMITEMRLLTLDADEDVAYNNTRYTFMAAVAGNDLYEGLQQGTQLFVDFCISRYNQVTQIHQALLIASVFLVLGFLGCLLWPHSRRMLRDASRQSGLLSLVPPELDVRGHVRGVYRRMTAGARRKRE
ncbi:hypothetical protein GPECTOR_25g435 [Gonium pectorale]|uniref:PAS domain-containing protein n=1 Tax=Gonium pectorale TaxID=33097 RepID=A0A150GHL7_GONPE|nr:hypothetical protein GPECTOR_25g435 [Gonium pectorale]|eukprot:KXZ48850.1 hypothetical protein GPECTOR_25g435 [Gonium pectorale]